MTTLCSTGTVISSLLLIDSDALIPLHGQTFSDAVFKVIEVGRWTATA